MLSPQHHSTASEDVVLESKVKDIIEDDSRCENTVSTADTGDGVVATADDAAVSDGIMLDVGSPSREVVFVAGWDEQDLYSDCEEINQGVENMLLDNTTGSTLCENSPENSFDGFRSSGLVLPDDLADENLALSDQNEPCPDLPDLEFSTSVADPPFDASDTLFIMETLQPVSAYDLVSQRSPSSSDLAILSEETNDDFPEPDVEEPLLWGDDKNGSSLCPDTQMPWSTEDLQHSGTTSSCFSDVFSAAMDTLRGGSSCFLNEFMSLEKSTISLGADKRKTKKRKRFQPSGPVCEPFRPMCQDDSSSEQADGKQAQTNASESDIISKSLSVPSNIVQGHDKIYIINEEEAARLSPISELVKTSEARQKEAVSKVARLAETYRSHRIPLKVQKKTVFCNQTDLFQKTVRQLMQVATVEKQKSLSFAKHRSTQSVGEPVDKKQKVLMEMEHSQDVHQRETEHSQDVHQRETEHSQGVHQMETENSQGVHQMETEYSQGINQNHYHSLTSNTSRPASATTDLQIMNGADTNVLSMLEPKSVLPQCGELVQVDLTQKQDNQVVNPSYCFPKTGSDTFEPSTVNKDPPVINETESGFPRLLGTQHVLPKSCRHIPVDGTRQQQSETTSGEDDYTSILNDTMTGTQDINIPEFSETILSQTCDSRIHTSGKTSLPGQDSLGAPTLRPSSEPFQIKRVPEQDQERTYCNDQEMVNVDIGKGHPQSFMQEVEESWGMPSIASSPNKLSDFGQSIKSLYGVPRTNTDTSTIDLSQLNSSLFDNEFYPPQPVKCTGMLEYLLTDVADDCRTDYSTDTAPVTFQTRQTSATGDRSCDALLPMGDSGYFDTELGAVSDTLSQKENQKNVSLNEVNFCKSDGQEEFDSCIKELLQYFDSSITSRTSQGQLSSGDTHSSHSSANPCQNTTASPDLIELLESSDFDVSEKNVSTGLPIPVGNEPKDRLADQSTDLGVYLNISNAACPEGFKDICNLASRLSPEDDISINSIDESRGFPDFNKLIAALPPHGEEPGAECQPFSADCPHALLSLYLKDIAKDEMLYSTKVHSVTLNQAEVYPPDDNGPAIGKTFAENTPGLSESSDTAAFDGLPMLTELDNDHQSKTYRLSQVEAPDEINTGRTFGQNKLDARNRSFPVQTGNFSKRKSGLCDNGLTHQLTRQDTVGYNKQGAVCSSVSTLQSQQGESNVSQVQNGNTAPGPATLTAVGRFSLDACDMTPVSNVVLDEKTGFRRCVEECAVELPDQLSLADKCQEQDEPTSPDTSSLLPSFPQGEYFPSACPCHSQGRHPSPQLNYRHMYSNPTPLVCPDKMEQNPEQTSSGIIKYKPAESDLHMVRSLSSLRQSRKKSCNETERKNWSYKLRGFSIGQFQLSFDECGPDIRSQPRIKIYLQKRKLLYELVVTNPEKGSTAEGGRPYQLVLVTVDFDNVRGIWGVDDRLLLQLKTAPQMVTPLVAPQKYKRKAPWCSSVSVRPIDITGGLLDTIPYHCVHLQGCKVANLKSRLCEDPLFLNLLLLPVTFDPQLRLPSSTSGKPKTHETTCKCKEGCKFPKCRCRKQGTSCNTFCGCCQQCFNPFTVFHQLRVPLADVHADACLMENVGIVTDMNRYLSCFVHLGCCGATTALRECVPNVRRCSTCTQPFRFSWCKGKICYISKNSLNHCEICKKCVEQDRKHCPMCNKCGLMAAGAGICKKCSPEDNPQRQVISAPPVHGCGDPLPGVRQLVTVWAPGGASYIWS